MKQTTRTLTAIAVSAILAGCGGGGSGGGIKADPFNIQQLAELGEDAAGAVMASYQLNPSDQAIASNILVDLENETNKRATLATKIANNNAWANSAGGKEEIAAFNTYYYIANLYRAELIKLADGEAIETDNTKFGSAAEFDNYVTKVITMKLETPDPDTDTIPTQEPDPITVISSVSDTATSTNVSDSNPIVETTYSDSDSTVSNNNGSETTITTRTYTDITSVVRTTTNTSVTTTVTTYSDNSTSTVVGNPTSTATTATVIIDTATRTAVVDSNTTVVLVDTEVTDTTDTVITNSDPIVTTTYVDTDVTVTNGNGSETTTTTRTFTDTTTVIRTTTDTVTRTTVKSYSDGSTQTTAVTLDPTSSTESIVTTATRTAVVDSNTTVVETGSNTTDSTETTVTDGAPTVTTTYVDSDADVTNGNGSVTTTTTRTYTDTTTVVRTTSSVTTHTTVTNYSDSSTQTSVVVDDAVVTTADIITTATRTEVVGTSTTVVLTDSQSVITSETTVSDSDPLVTTTFVDNTTTVDNGNGTQTNTTVRTYTDTTTVVRTTTVTPTTTITLTYSDNSEQVNAVVGTPVVTTENVITTDTRTAQTAQWTEAIPTNDHADLGTRTVGYNSDVTHYDTSEFKASNGITSGPASVDAHDPLRVIKADIAYSRGWTGSGTTILIMDTGIQEDHSEFANKIVGTKSFVQIWDEDTQSVIYDTIDDEHGHGTHVAGIAAGAKDGNGMHGVAYDADLVIAKIGYDSGQVNISAAPDAIAWGNTNGAVVGNISSNMRYDAAWKASVTDKGNGVYVSDHAFYSVNGYNDAKADAVKWKAAMGTDMIVVNSAGNAGEDYPESPGILSTEVDADDNLMLDGRLIIAGNWNAYAGVIDGSRSGHICRDWNIGTATCDDTYRMWDFYLLAPGMNISSAAIDGGYTNMSGTSMAAPTIAGAVAVLSQMWPHMSGSNLVRLLMETGDKTITGYDEHTHGQGLLDMDAATNPVGATGIPTTGRTDGAVSSIAGGAAGNGAISGSLSSVMVLDSFERDFYVNFSDVEQLADTRPGSLIQTLHNNGDYSTYGNLAATEFNTKFDLGDGYHMRANVNNGFAEGSNVAVGYTFKEGNFTATGELGFTQEYNKFLNMQTSGSLAVGESANTLYTNINLNYAATNQVDFFGGVAFGRTEVGTAKGHSLVSGVDTLSSQSMHIGSKYRANEKWSFMGTVARPLHITGGDIHYNVPTSRTADGTVINEQFSSSLSSKTVETDFGLSVQYTNKKNNFKASMFGEYRKNYMNTEGKTDTIFGLNVHWTW